ncbi:MAG: tetratricopeptide repeat protein [Actinomycetota bacterium]
MPSKILPPELPSRFVPRHRLKGMLDQVLGHRLTTVVAGAGFGKSTLLASWAEQGPVVWYTLDPGDTALGPFARALGDAIRLRVPGLPADLAGAAAGRGPGADERSRAEALAGLMCEALHEQLTEDLALILDDVGEIDPDSPVAGMIEALCRQAPGALHVVIASRSEPPFSIQRLRGRGQVLEIRGPQLSFGLEEVEVILRASAIEPEGLAEPLHEMTGGWPAAVRMAAEMLGTTEQGDRASALKRLARPEGPLFDYLAEEVLRSESREVHDLLARVAFLDRFSPELCRALGIEGAEELLARLLRRSILVEPLSGGGGWMRLNPLVREVLLQRDDDGESRPSLLGRAAEWLERSGEPEQALRCLRAAGDQDALGRFLLDQGERLIDAGAARDVAQAAAEIDRPSPELQIVLGIARQALGEWDSALRVFDEATGDAASIPARVAWRIGVIHYLRGEADAVREAFKRGRVERGDTADEALLLAWRAALHWMQGDEASCRSDVERAISAAAASRDLRASAAAHTASAMLAALVGDRRANDAHYLQALDAAERAGDLFQVVRIRTNRSSNLYEEGWYEQAREEVDLAIRAGEIAGFAPLLALAYTNRANISVREGKLDEAVGDFQLARALYQRLDSRRIAYPLGGLGDVYRERGDLALARGCYEEAIRQSEPTRDLQGLVSSMAGLARVVVAEDPEEALALAERAMSFGDNLDELFAVLSAGWVHLVLGNRNRALELGRSADLLARERRDRAGLAEALELQGLAEEPVDAEVFEQADRLWRELGNELAVARLALVRERVGGVGGTEDTSPAERRLAAFGLRLPATAAGPLAALPVVATKAVEVKTLGGFALLHGGRPFPVADWQSKKSRDLLKILLARRGRPAHREALMDALWPDEDPDSVANRLSVALSGLRSALDPDRRFDADHFVTGDRETVGLNLGHLVIDVERFMSLVARGRSQLRSGEEDQGLSALEAAEALYTGDFLEEDAYEEWAVPLREEARAAYIAAARALAERAAANGDHDSAVRCSLRILERDPFDEWAGLNLVGAAVAAGRHGEARRHYATYAARMRELEVEPASFPASGESSG